jgi:hypothetical protein
MGPLLKVALCTNVIKMNIVEFLSVWTKLTYCILFFTPIPKYKPWFDLMWPSRSCFDC